MNSKEEEANTKAEYTIVLQQTMDTKTDHYSIADLVSITERTFHGS